MPRAKDDAWKQRALERAEMLRQQALSLERGVREQDRRAEQARRWRFVQHADTLGLFALTDEEIIARLAAVMGLTPGEQDREQVPVEGTES